MRAQVFLGMHSRKIVSVVALAMLAGCGGIKDAIRMPNPLASGGVQPNRAEERREYYESMYGLEPGSFTTHASLASLDAAQVCFDVALKWIAEPGEVSDDASFVDVKQLVPHLRGRPGLLVEQAEVPAASPVTRGSVVGEVVVTRSEVQRICDNFGNNCGDRVVQRRVPVSKNMSVYDGQGRVCFAHAGKINTATEWLELVLSPPAYPTKETHRFAWKFDAGK